jgi:hypothetical protein
LYPNAKESIATALLWRNPQTSQLGERILTQHTLERMLNREVSLISYGRFDYEDVFGGQHWIKFCNYSSPLVPNQGQTAQERPPVNLGTTPNEKKCAEYNEIDK